MLLRSSQKDVLNPTTLQLNVVGNFKNKRRRQLFFNYKNCNCSLNTIKLAIGNNRRQ